MKTVKAVARETGISVRTLHYYDEIGLLKPSTITESGYRLYGKDDIKRLQQILFFRELDFPLKEIEEIINHPGFDEKAALTNHKKLLELKRERLDGLIRLVDTILKGETTMSFQEFDKTAIQTLREQYAEEVKECFGHTPAYGESLQKTNGYRPEDWATIQSEAAEIYEAFAAAMNQEPGAPQVQKLVEDWQNHITKYYYTCTKEILAGLGEMYVADERFQQNIDQYAPGLAAFMSRAIAVYCA